jgi:hypothetical protein
MNVDLWHATFSTFLVVQPQPQLMKIAIIGGGPSGLVTLKTFLEVGSRVGIQIEPILLESESES